MPELMESPVQPGLTAPSVQVESGAKTTAPPTLPIRASNLIKNKLKSWFWIADFVVLPFVFLSACILKIVRVPSIELMPFSKWAFDKIGVFPIKKHYYEPYIDVRETKKALTRDRDIPGIDWNDKEQLKILDRFEYNVELLKIPFSPTANKEFFYENTSFGPGDAEYLYNMIRLFRPKRIVEIGCGNSTLMAVNATRKNKTEDSDYCCDHVCIEPFEQPWLEQTGLRVIRNKIEDVDPIVSLEADDLLFIDSSHLVRPGGDVVTAYLELLPRLQSGVIVHVHDIFSPRDYPADWLLNKRLFLNEQYIVEAFLTCNHEFRVIAALNYLKHRYYDQLSQKCPRMSESSEPSSLYLMRC